MEELLRVEKLVKSYLKDGVSFNAIDNLDFSLQKGEILGIIGNNGAGKSTLLKLLSRITKPTSGTITYKGTLTSIIDIGTGFHPDLSGKENLYLTSRLLNKSYKIDSKTYNSIVSFSGLEEFIEVPVKNYSSGMYLRLAFSIAFHSDIDILLLDEVIAVGDQNFRKKCYEKIRELKDNKVGIILVSHDMENILEFCDKCILLNQGSKIIESKPFDVVEKYLSWNNYAGDNNSSINKKYTENKESDSVTYYEDLTQLKLDFIKIERLELTTKNSDCRELYLENDLKIIIDIESLTNRDSIEIGYHITNIHGQRILLDSYALRDDYVLKPFRKTNYKISCLIPNNLLNTGIYFVGIIINKNKKPIVEFPKVISFKLKSEKELKSEKRLNCIIRPKLEWQIDTIDSNNNNSSDDLFIK